MEFTKKTAPNRKGRYCFDGISEKNRRPTNMDSLIVLERNIGSDYLLLAVVSDGVGSLERGGFAAMALTRGLMGWFTTLESVDNILNDVREEIFSINREVFAASTENGFQSAATLTLLLIMNEDYYAFNAGDSRIYMLHNGKLEQITRDDVSDTGALTEYIGFEQLPNLSFSQGDAAGRLFLLCSDGLYKRMDPAYLRRQLEGCNEGNLRNCITTLIRRVADQGETDNISVAIIKDCMKGN